MPKYRVTVPEIYNQDYIVEADTEEQALEIASADGEPDDNSLTYVREHTDGLYFATGEPPCVKN